MAKAKKLPSGSWRVRVYSHTSDGVKHYESFTASTKQEAEMLAAQFANSRGSRTAGNLTVSEAINGYITAKTNVLSPSTIRAYRSMESKYFDTIGTMKVKRLTTEDVQLYISHISTLYSAKTVKNAHALLKASVRFYEPDKSFKVSLPTAIRKTAAAPDSSDVMRLYELASDWMRKCIVLAAFGSLRRGEIAAIKYGDIKGDSVFIHADLVMDENNKWVYKDMPKNQSSVRYVRLPQRVIEMLGSGPADAFIITYNPNTISKMFNKLRTRAGVDVRFHDLRHYYASIGAVLGIPDIYLADFGGWRHDSPVMKSVYQGNITSVADAYAKKMTDYFSGLLSDAE